MKKNIILTLKYNLSNFPKWMEDEQESPIDPEYFDEMFYQGDVYIHDMGIVGVEIEEVEE